MCGQILLVSVPVNVSSIPLHLEGQNKKQKSVFTFIVGTVPVLNTTGKMCAQPMNQLLMQEELGILL